MIQCQNNCRIYNEAIIEHVRASKYQECTSRLRGMYFFRSKEEAVKRIGDINWPPYFCRENLTELELFSSNKITEVDSNWITFAKLGENGRICKKDTQWISDYWSGKPYEHREPVWELIANGHAVVIDEGIRRRAECIVKNTFPESAPSILMSRLAGEAGTIGGMITPYLVSRDESVQLVYLYRDQEFHDKGVIEKIAKHPDANLLGKLMRANDEWKIPDFSRWNRTFQIEEQDVLDDGESRIISMHEYFTPESSLHKISA